MIGVKSSDVSRSADSSYVCGACGVYAACHVSVASLLLLLLFVVILFK